jgi:hypothetical protein
MSIANKEAIAKAIIHMEDDPRCKVAREAITALFSALELSPEEGENILAYLLGVSLGMRQVSIPNSTPIGVVALVWTMTNDVMDNEGEKRL